MLTCLGYTGPEGLLTFKLDTTASDWDGTVYMAVVKKLADALQTKAQKSILECVPSLRSQSHPMLTSWFSGPAARAVWEAAIRVHEDPILPAPDVPKEDPPNPPSKPRAGLRP